MNLKSNKAITLVALIITIIVLLILAGVSLSMVLGENGLINKAQSSVNRYKESSENEQKLLNSIESYMDLQLKSPGTKVDVPDGWNKDTVDAVLDDKKNIIPVPKNFYYVGGNLDNGVIISDDPADAYDGTTDKTTWEYTTSLAGNQFIWIPCTEEEYHKTDWGSNYMIGGNYDTSGISTKEVEQIKKYGGFYIGRYEAGLADEIIEYSGTVLSTSNVGYNIDGIPLSKAGKIPWNFISYEFCKKNAEKMYEKSETVSSKLISGTQWDVMIQKCIGKTNESGIIFSKNDLFDSGLIGNYGLNSISYSGRSATATLNDTKWYITDFKNKITGETERYTLFTTGASKVSEMYHTYDIAGNLWEYTDEIGNSEIEHVFRGGSFRDPSNIHPVCYRHCDGNLTGVDCGLGFRVVLYLM